MVSGLASASEPSCCAEPDHGSSALQGGRLIVEMRRKCAKPHNQAVAARRADEEVSLDLPDHEFSVTAQALAPAFDRLDPFSMFGMFSQERLQIDPAAGRWDLDLELAEPSEARWHGCGVLSLSHSPFRAVVEWLGRHTACSGS